MDPAGDSSIIVVSSVPAQQHSTLLKGLADRRDTQRDLPGQFVWSRMEDLWSRRDLRDQRCETATVEAESVEELPPLDIGIGRIYHTAREDGISRQEFRVPMTYQA